MSNGSSKDVFDRNGNFHSSLYFSKEMKRDLGIAGFPLELTINPKQPTPKIPAVPYSSSPHTLHDRLINHDIYVTPSDKFSINFRDIFHNNVIQHGSGSESNKWLRGPNTCMSYRPQQINFALWCATTGFGFSIRTLFNDEITDSELVLPPQVRSFLWFHVYFTVRRISYEMGGVQGPVALPGDTNLKWLKINVTFHLTIEFVMNLG